MAYGNFKDLPRSTALDKLLLDKAFKIAKNPKYDGYQRDLASMVYKFFDKKFNLRAVKSVSTRATSGGAVKTEVIAVKVNKKTAFFGLSLRITKSILIL